MKLVIKKPELYSSPKGNTPPPWWLSTLRNIALAWVLTSTVSPISAPRTAIGPSSV
jgi:hypothetical protein